MRLPASLRQGLVRVMMIEAGPKADPAIPRPRHVAAETKPGQ